MVNIFAIKRQECIYTEFPLDFTKCCFEIVSVFKCAPEGRKGTNSYCISTTPCQELSTTLHLTHYNHITKGYFFLTLSHR